VLGLPALSATLTALLALLPNGIVYYTPVLNADEKVLDFHFSYLNVAAHARLAGTASWELLAAVAGERGKQDVCPSLRCVIGRYTSPFRLSSPSQRLQHQRHQAGRRLADKFLEAYR
jgi:hypothetical protein